MEQSEVKSYSTRFAAQTEKSIAVSNCSHHKNITVLSDFYMTKVLLMPTFHHGAIPPIHQREFCPPEK
jgi:hypothetical protein